MSFYLAYKEVWRNRSRFFLFSMVIALITTLVLFIAALAQGLANANIQYLQNIDAQLVVFQKNVELSANASQIERSTINNLTRVEGVAATGSIGFTTGKTRLPNGKPLDISIIGVEPDLPGSPDVIRGEPIRLSRGMETVIDSTIARQAGVEIGDTLTITTLQGTEEQAYNLRVTGVTSEQQYLYAPSLFVPIRTWDQVRPQSSSRTGFQVELTSNVVAIKLQPGADLQTVAQRIRDQVSGVEVADVVTAYRAIPGYLVQQSTLDTQQGFTLLIGVLVIGGFFQIQMLQKIPQIGVLKAIGASNSTVAMAAIIQIIMVTTFGVGLGGLITFLLSLGIPAAVPLVFQGSTVAIAVVALLLIGPLGGLVTVRLAVSVEPLRALGLSS